MPSKATPINTNAKLLASTKSSITWAKAPESGSIHSNLLRESTDDVFKKYKVEQVLGQGSMGAVSKVRIRADKIGGSAFETKKTGFFGFMARSKKVGRLTSISQDHVYALKSIILDRMSETFVVELRNEINVLRILDHPNIVKLHEVYWSKNQIYLVLELCDGGDLYTRSPYSEYQSAKIVNKLLSAIRYMHDNGVVHRDLKYENIMFENTKDDAEVKIIDFGLSKKFFGRPEYMTERVGTIYTMAPQVLQGIYSAKADLWSIGVITYMLLSSTKPFYDKRRHRMIDLIMRAEYKTEGPIWDQVSDLAKDFVSHLLVLDPKRRFDASQAVQHDWIVKRKKLPHEVIPKSILMGVEDSILNYQHTSALKKLALNVIAHRSTTDEILQLRKVFDQFDTERNGVISYAEFRQALEKMNYSEDAIKEMFKSVDFNQNGKINYTEFIAATIEAHGHISEDRIAEAFDRLDADGDGYISKHNIRDVLGKDCRKEDIDAMMAADTNKDGQISYQEFLAAFRARTYDTVFQSAQLFTESSSSTSMEQGLVGLDAKIPGGRYDSNLRPNVS